MRVNQTLLTLMLYIAQSVNVFLKCRNYHLVTINKGTSYVNINSDRRLTIVLFKGMQ